MVDAVPLRAPRAHGNALYLRCFSATLLLRFRVAPNAVRTGLGALHLPR